MKESDEGGEPTVPQKDVVTTEHYAEALKLLTLFAQTADDDITRITDLDALNAELRGIGPALKTVITTNGHEETIKYYVNGKGDRRTQGFRWQYKDISLSKPGFSLDAEYFDPALEEYEKVGSPRLRIEARVTGNPKKLTDDTNYTLRITLPAETDITLTEGDWMNSPKVPMQTGILPHEEASRSISTKNTTDRFRVGEKNNYLKPEIHAGYASVLKELAGLVVNAAKPPTTQLPSV